MTFEPGARIAQYRLVEKIGEGGMGVVWKALDTDLNRHVALKLLPADLTADPERRLRFRREAQAAAALGHPNIAVIHQVGEHEGSPFIAMELLQGKSLRDRLAAGPLGLRAWIGVALPLAEALAHAHRHGVVHRDLKPDNVMITADGQVKILDFGLAKLVQPAADPAPAAGTADRETRLRTISRELTRQGKVFGTVSYMSPEQARGEPVDHRSDLFSFGIMLYEAIGGRLPFRAASDVETLSAIITAEPRSLTDTAPECPAEGDRIVRKAMEKSAADRYQSAEEMVVDLRNLQRDLDSGRATRPSPAAAPGAGSRRALAAAAALVVVLGAVAVWAIRGRGGAAQPARIGSVAVLPFEIRAAAGGVEDVDYLGDGITESLINRLSKIDSLRVVPRSVVFGYKGSADPPQVIGRQLDVGAVVTGRITARGESLDVTAELIDVASVAQIWGDRYGRTRADIFEVQEEITREIVRSLHLTLTPEEERAMARRPTENPEAYEAYLRGQGLAVFYTQDELERARGYFERALEIDPAYPLALAGLATVEAQIYRNVEANPEFLVRAMDYARRAIDLDPGLARAHAALAEVYAAQYRYEEATRHAREAVRLEPGEPSFHDTLSWVLAYRTPPDAIGAEKAARDAIRISPRFAIAYYHLGRALIAQGRLDEAIAAFEYVKVIDRGPSTGDLGLGQAYLAAGEFDRALEKLEAHGLATPLARVYAAAALAGRGDRDRALGMLESAVRDGYRDAPFLAASPLFDALRTDARFDAILAAARRGDHTSGGVTSPA